LLENDEAGPGFGHWIALYRRVERIKGFLKGR
jgi:hypothetical protein